MPIVINSTPDIINSVNDDVSYIFEVTPNYLFFQVNSLTPFGLAIVTLNDTTNTAPPTVFVGQTLHCTDSASSYYGSHIITELISTGTYSQDVVINTIYAGIYNPSSFRNCEQFDLMQIVFFTNTITSGVAYHDQKFTVKFQIENNIISLHLQEYCRSFFPSQNIYHTNKKSVIISLDEYFYPTIPYASPITVVNSTLTTSDLKKLYYSSGYITPKLLDNSSRLIFFKDYKTYITDNYLYFMISSDIIFGETTSNYTQGATYTGNKLSTQVAEVLSGCFKDPINIVYVNFAGGIRNYVCFNDIKTERNFENEIRYKDAALNEKTLSVQSYKSYDVHCADVRTTHSEAIEQMIASPSTWIDIAGTLYPIVIDKKTFQTYHSYDEYLNFSFSFRMSETKQSQVN